MVEFSQGEIIFLSSISTFIIMFIVIYVQWRLEKETNGSRPLFVFHFCNVVTMMMFYGVTYNALVLSMGTFSESGGYLLIFLNSTVYPFPFIFIVYLIAATIYSKYLRPVMSVKGTNVIVMRRKWRMK